MADPTEDVVQSNAATPEDIRSALEAARDDSDTAGSAPLTTTDEAKGEARKILSRVGAHDTEAAQLRKDIESNAEASRQALIRAQRILQQHWQETQPSEQELLERSMAAWMRPNPGVGMAGAPIAQGANFNAEQANQAAQQRAARAAYLQMASGQPLQEELSKINTTTTAAKEKLLDMQMKHDAELGRSAMTALGRMSTSPAAQAGMKPNSSFGKIALDQLGPAAYNVAGDPSSGFSDTYRSLVQRLNDTAIAEARARAGIDDTQLDPVEKFQNANLAGVPIMPVGLPDLHTYSTKQRNEFYKAEQKDADNAFKSYGADDEVTMQALRSLDQFQELNKHTFTGPTIAPTKIGGVHAGPHGAGADLGADSGGINIWPPSIFAHMTSNVQTMDKLAAGVVAQAIPPRGFNQRVTNKDLGLFQSASIGTDKNRQTNDSISEALRITLNNNLERHKFEQAYFGVHKTLKGAIPSWEQYLNDNPIFDHSKPYLPNGLKPYNPNRLSWQEYFQRKNGPLPVAGAATPDNPHGRAGRPGYPVANPDDMAPAHAEGGRVGLAEGGQPDQEIQNSLHALMNGLSLRGKGLPEDSNSPGENLLGEAAGAGLTGGAALLALRQPARLARLMAEHPHITASVLGGGAGGVSSGMSGGDPFVGAASGATLGPLFSMGARGAFRLGTGALDRLRGQVIGPGVRKSIEAIEGDTHGDWDQVSDSLADDAKAKIPSILGEVGPRSTGLTRSAIYKDSPGSEELLGQLQDRQADAPGRVADRVNNALAPDNYMLKSRELMDALYTKAKPLYDQAFSQFPQVKSAALQELMNTPSGQEAAARAFKMMQDKQVAIGQPDALGMVQHPSLEYLDQVKRALDDMIIGEEGSGANYQATEQGRILRGMRSKLVGELDKSTMGANGQPSPYRAARDQYAGDIDVLDALRTGRESFDKMTPDEVRALMGKIDYSSRDAFRSGVAEGLFQKIGNMGQGRNSAMTIVGNPNVQQKIAAIFDNPKDAQKFLEAVTRESEIFGSGQMLMKQGERGAMASMQPRSISQMLRGQLMRPGTADEISTTMGMTPNDPEAKEKLSRLREQADRLRSRQNWAGLAGGAGAVAGGTALAPGLLTQGQQ